MASPRNPIDRFLEGINTADLELMLNAFAPDAEVVDDGKSFTGDAIIALCEHGIIGRQARVKVLDQTVRNDGRTQTHIMMDGDFGKEFGIHEPFDLFLVVTVKGDKIIHLHMGDIDPDKPTMRAVYASVASPQDPLSSVRIGQRHLPESKEGWVRVKMQAVGLNFHDIFTLRGMLMHETRYPMILGNEGAGLLEDGTEVAVYPVMGDPDWKGNETLDPKRHVFGELVQGTLAEYAMIPRRNAVPRPKGLDAKSASVMGIAWLTAYRMLFTQAKIRAGQTILVQGSSGGVTTALIQLGSAAGFRVWATGRTKAKRDLARSLGAESTFEPGAKLPHLVDAAFDTSGASTISHSLASVKPGGTIVSCGRHSDSASPNIWIDLLHLMVNQISLVGVYTGTREEFVNLLNFVTTSGIKPHIGKVLPLAEAAEGLKEIWQGKTNGKVVVEI
ncbi:putative zinc-type alcohol dehydrogenase-like protein YogA [Fonsecaea pedrosoi]|nr:putative zinc-type alcohol dehydrogenase-like protein YogA [Fonsecaea pedrosoi]